MSSDLKSLPSIESLERISAFVLNRTSNDCRLELYEHLIMMALYEAKDNGEMRRETIVSWIENDLKVKDLPQKLLDKALQRLCEKGSVKTVHDRTGDIYFLTQDERTRIKLMIEHYSGTVGQVKKSLSAKMKEKGIELDMAQEEIVFVTFRNFLAVTLSRLGRECCFALLGSKGKSIDSFKPVNVSELLDRVLETVDDWSLRNAERQVFAQYILGTDDALSDFLYSLAQSYFFIQVLHLDPECQALTRTSVQQKRIFLDTNIIFFALTGGKGQKAVDEALKLTAKIGFTLVISKMTRKEFSSLLKTRRATFGKNPNVPGTRFEKMSGSLEDGFLKDFLRKKQENPHLTFDGYADRLEEVGAIMGNRYGAILDENEYTDALDSPDLSALKDIVVAEGANFHLLKSDAVAEHDAFHILLVQDLRRKDSGDALGPKFWFLTRDRSLLFVEKRFAKFESFPSSVYVDNWIQMISPLLSPIHVRDARDAYVGLFASRLPAITGGIDEQIFFAFQGKWMDDEDLSARDIARIVGNRYVREYYERMKEPDKPVPEEDKEKMINSIVAEVKAQRRESAWIKQEMSHLRNTTSVLQTEVTGLKTLSQRQQNMLSRIGHFVGGAIFFLLWLGFYEYFIRYHSVEHLPAFFCSMILAAAIGTLADLGGYRWLLNRLLRYRAENGTKE